LFYVDLTVNCNVVIPENFSVFSLKATYRGVVVVNFSLPDEKIRECLNILVPQVLYESIRDVIYSVSMLSGWTPIEMEYYSFKTKSIVSI
ncbi:MAG: protein-export chaperone SecB, partial [Clostridia bacterium]|nr:protein-export chaperone SecB [Clostridia bacterium]